MSVRVLGCSGSIAADCRTTSFLLDEAILVDAGTGVGDLQLDEMAKIEHILLTHSHLDHVVSIAFLVDAVIRRRLQAALGPIVVHALPQTIEALKTHVFNGIIWPDFGRIPSADRPSLAFEPLAVGDVLTLCGRQIEVLPALHTVAAVGYAVRGAAGHWVFTGDTGPNPALWARLADLTVAHLVIETAFGNDERALAELSGHLCPQTLAAELTRLSPQVRVHITHIKPGEVAAVMGELAVAGIRQPYDALRAGQVLAFD